MSDNVTIAVIVAVSTIIQAWIALKGRADSQEEHQETKKAVEDVHQAVNSRMDQLVAASKAQGAADQRAETRQDAKDALG